MIKNMGKGSGNFNIERARKIRELASNSVGDSSYPTSYFRYIIKTLLYYKNQKKCLYTGLAKSFTGIFFYIF